MTARLDFGKSSVNRQTALRVGIGMTVVLTATGCTADISPKITTLTSPPASIFSPSATVIITSGAYPEETFDGATYQWISKPSFVITVTNFHEVRPVVTWQASFHAPPCATIGGQITVTQPDGQTRLFPVTATPSLIKFKTPAAADGREQKIKFSYSASPCRVTGDPRALYVSVGDLAVVDSPATASGHS